MRACRLQALSVEIKEKSKSPHNNWFLYKKKIVSHIYKVKLISIDERILQLGLKGSRRCLFSLYDELKTLFGTMKNLLALFKDRVFIIATYCLDCLAMTSNTNDWSTFTLELIFRVVNVRTDRLAKYARARGFRFSHINLSVYERKSFPII